MVAYEQRDIPLASSRETGRKRRKEIYEFVCNYADELNGPTPSINEIATKLHIDYKVTYYHVMKLMAHGLLGQERGKITVKHSEWERPEFPLIP